MVDTTAYGEETMVDTADILISGSRVIMEELLSVLSSLYT